MAWIMDEFAEYLEALESLEKEGIIMCNKCGEFYERGTVHNCRLQEKVIVAGD